MVPVFELIKDYNDLPQGTQVFRNIYQIYPAYERAPTMTTVIGFEQYSVPISYLKFIRYVPLGAMYQ
jgi:hypothetical protein